jgi:phosphinothricin acetyltransferase
MHIRPIEEQDFQHCLKVMNEAIRNGKNAFDAPLEGEEARAWFQQLRNRSFIALVLESPEGEVIGWGNLAPYRSNRGGLKHVAEVTFYLAETFTGQGWGHLLLGALEAQAVKKGLSVLVAILRSDNAHSRSFLLKKGYKEWACFDGLIRLGQGSTGHLYMGKALDL